MKNIGYWTHPCLTADLQGMGAVNSLLHNLTCKTVISFDEAEDKSWNIIYSYVKLN